MILVGGGGADDLVVRGARVLDPTEGIDSVLDVRIDGGMITAIGVGLDANGHRVIAGEGLVLAPAFIDPHVHLRTPGREDEETIASGTAAAAAGGYCAILAMPNTEPVVDNADVLRGLRARAAQEAQIPVGFTAAITVGQEGAQLTEMGELADAGAAAFTDDGRPVATAGLMRRALEYNAITGLRARAPLRGADASPVAGTCTWAPSRPSSASVAGPRSARASASPASSRSPPTPASRST